MHMCVYVCMRVSVTLSSALRSRSRSPSLPHSRTLTRSACTLANEFDIERGTYTPTILNRGCSVCMLSKGLTV